MVMKERAMIAKKRNGIVIPCYVLFFVITSSKACNEFCTRLMFILLLISLSVWPQNVHSAFFLQLPCGLICKEY